MKTLPWFRFYHEAIDDEKLGLLAFEDRWHFVALLCLKCKGVLDTEPDAEMLSRKVALKMGLTCAELEKVARRLARMNLIDADTFQPNAWDERQMRSDHDMTNAERQARYRESLKGKSRVSNALRNAPVTGIDTDTDTDTDKEEDKKNTKTRANAPPDGVSPSLWADFKKIRAAKKAAITETAMNGIAREAQAAGISLADALTMCCERNWIAFKADWYDNATAKPTAMKAANSETTYQRSMRERVAEFSPSIAKQAPGAPYTLSNMTLEAENVTTITRS